ncbi:FAST kinase domain-containing protein 3, mitochondrial-like [Aricia agestis]|uniref:FAST kinase domain-containing protein 3, mitochondrial-like n=1 Tax=Aricia agestis TaxID=91739 RepID=UPI001C20C0A0|nr:FAST kinase domain-containing protein 3, mitochondrial-like [Aricia agestis]
MTQVLLRSYSKARGNIMFSCGSANSLCHWIALFSRSSSDDKSNHPEFTNSTILIENGYSVHELPVLIRKLKDLDFTQTSGLSKNTSESVRYDLIQEEFKQCKDLREVFSLITKCTKITPNIALGAIERIYALEQELHDYKLEEQSVHINFAKGAILEKLQKVVMKTEDTQTILNVLNTNSVIMEPFKHKFSDELMVRLIENKLTIDQLCEFATFLINNNTDQKYKDTIDRLWVGFIDKEKDIDENNISSMFNILPGLKASKRTMFLLLEQKFSEVWNKIKFSAMQDILNVLIIEKGFSMQMLTVLSHWLYANIHSLHEDEILDMVTKFTHLKYSDDQVVAAIEKYMRLKGPKIHTHVFIAGVYNYCMQFQICNKPILNACSKYFLSNIDEVPPSFLKCFICPHGYLFTEPENGMEYWNSVEDLLLRKFDKVSIDDMCSIILSFLYLEHHPLKLISKIFNPSYTVKINNPETYKKLQLIDTALSLECKTISGPMLPKNQCYTPITQDTRIKNMLSKINQALTDVIGDSNSFSTAVPIPNYCSDSTYIIDVMLHPPRLGTGNFKWNMKSDNITAFLIHLPEHYCSNGKTLIGPQAMRIRHMKILGLKVVSLKYFMLSQLYASQDKDLLKNYIQETMEDQLTSL